MATRTYASGNRTFEITLAETPAGRWTVEHVYDKSLNAEIRVPGVASIVDRRRAFTGDYRQVVAVQDLTTTVRSSRAGGPSSVPLDRAIDTL